MTTLQEISILRQNGEEVTLSFSEAGVLKTKSVSGTNDKVKMETHYFRKDPKRYPDIIGDTLKREDIHNAIAISGIFKEDDGTIIEQEGLLGNIFYSNIVKEIEVQGE